MLGPCVRLSGKLKTNQSNSANSVNSNPLETTMKANIFAAILGFLIAAEFIVTGEAFLAPLLAAYLMPIVVALFRQHHSIGPISILTILLGWTGIAWVGCLAWSASRVQPIAA